MRSLAVPQPPSVTGLGARMHPLEPAVKWSGRPTSPFFNRAKNPERGASRTRSAGWAEAFVELVRLGSVRDLTDDLLKTARAPHVCDRRESRKKQR
jgi:hypothetical protein